MGVGLEAEPSAFGLGFIPPPIGIRCATSTAACRSIYGTVVSSLVALFIAVPISLGIAILPLGAGAPATTRADGLLVELLAPCPASFYGLWGIFSRSAPWLRESVEPFLGKTLGFLPLFQGAQHGFGMLAGRHHSGHHDNPRRFPSVSREVLRAVPRRCARGRLASARRAGRSYACAVLPYAKSGFGRAPSSWAWAVRWAKRWPSRW